MDRETLTNDDEDNDRGKKVGEEMNEPKSPQVDPRKSYEKPAVVTYASAQILESLGPALAHYGNEFGSDEIGG